MEEEPFVCPYCDTQLDLPDGAWYITCTKCRHHLDLKSQFAYLRGLDSFSEGQDIMQKVNPRKQRALFQPKVTEAMHLFMSAYTSIQVAFQAELAETQRALGVEMMSSMAQEFMKRNMVSAMEMSYWNTLMIEQTAQYEYDRLKEQLAGQGGGLWAGVKRWRWISRQKQLVRSLAQIDKKIKMLEKQIDFTDIPRARNEKWKP